MFAKLNGSTIFSTIDLRSGYYHIGLTEGSRPKSAFVAPMGKFEFLRTPFGLSQAPAHFQLLIDNVLQGCSKFAMGYLDHIIIFSRTEEHLEHLEKIFRKLREYGLKMKREKCNFFKKHLQYLGHLALCSLLASLDATFSSCHFTVCWFVKNLCMSQMNEWSVHMCCD